MSNFLLAAYIQNARYNDGNIVADGRHKLLSLLCVFHHPKYKETEFFDLVNKVSYPEEAKQLYLKTQLLQAQT